MANTSLQSGSRQDVFRLLILLRANYPSSLLFRGGPERYFLHHGPEPPKLHLLRGHVT